MEVKQNKKWRRRMKKLLILSIALLTVAGANASDSGGVITEVTRSRRVADTNASDQGVESPYQVYKPLSEGPVMAPGGTEEPLPNQVSQTSMVKPSTGGKVTSKSEQAVGAALLDVAKALKKAAAKLGVVPGIANSTSQNDFATTTMLQQRQSIPDEGSQNEPDETRDELAMPIPGGQAGTEPAPLSDATSAGGSANS
ncbi:MAG: hypothetical protein ACJAZS_000805 [Alteromonas naphthalenivorans]|jgi:hypothetical protein